MTRYRITVRGTDIELRGVVDGGATLQLVSQAFDGLAMVIASPADEEDQR